MAEVPEELAVARELLQSVAAALSGNPDVALLVDGDGVLAACTGLGHAGRGPVGMVAGAAPRVEQVALDVELENRRRRLAAVGPRRVGHQAGLVRRDIARPAHNPDVIL